MSHQDDADATATRFCLVLFQDVSSAKHPTSKKRSPNWVSSSKGGAIDHVNIKGCGFPRVAESLRSGSFPYGSEVGMSGCHVGLVVVWLVSFWEMESFHQFYFFALQQRFNCNNLLLRKLGLGCAQPACMQLLAWRAWPGCALALPFKGAGLATT